MLGKDYYNEQVLKSHYKFYTESDKMKPKLWDRLDSKSKEILHIASRGDSNRAIMVFGEDDTPLYQSNLAQLLDSTRLDTSTIDACLCVISTEFNKKNVHIASVSDALQVFHSEEPILPDAVRFESASLVVLPCIASNHWFLSVLDFKQTKLYVLDPSEDGHDPIEIKNMTVNLNAFLSKTRHNLKKFSAAKSQRWKFPKQGDDVNCGVFILRYAEALLKGETGLVAFDVEEYRVDLAQRLLADLKSQHDNSAELYGDHLLFPRFENGLLDSVEYYCAPYECCPPEKPDRIVADFGLGFYPIEASHMRGLIGREWLTNFVIDVAINAAITDEMRSEYINVRTKDSSLILEKSWDKALLSYISLDHKTLIMPVLLGRCHWCLLWVNIQSKVYRFFDPRDLADSRRYFGLILDYLRFYNDFSNEKIDLTGWKTMELTDSLPQQNDSSNCGVFVIFYTFYLLGLEQNCVLDICAYRKKLARFILETAPNMKHLCGICGRNEFWRPADLFEIDEKEIQDQKTPTSMTRMVRCEMCRRWIHHCCDRLLKHVPFNEICTESYIYHCETCTSFTGKGKTQLCVRWWKF